MPAGTWSFLHETVIYEYMMHRNAEGQLRLRMVVRDGRLEMKERWFKVNYLQEIRDTFFPDVKNFIIKGDSKGERPAEVKFVTSAFNYHKSKQHKDSYKNFSDRNGCLIVLKHDFLIDEINMDVFELDEIDFISFVKENFIRFLNRQLRVHNFRKVWIMIQSKNFYEGAHGVLPACESGLWCPTDNLTGFDLAVGDKVLFIRTRGASKQNVNKYWSHGQIYDKWILSQIWIGEVTSPIKSREEYCQTRGRNMYDPLWYDETEVGRNDKRITQRKTTGLRWKRVFEFKKTNCLKNLDIPFEQLNMVFPEFVKAIVEVYTNTGSREIGQDLYISIMEYISGLENERKEQLLHTFMDQIPTVIPQQVYGETPLIH